MLESELRSASPAAIEHNASFLTAPTLDARKGANHAEGAILVANNFESRLTAIAAKCTWVQAFFGDIHLVGVGAGTL